MSGVAGIGGVDRVMALRAQILERNAALSRAAAPAPASAPEPVGKASGAASFVGSNRNQAPPSGPCSQASITAWKSGGSSCQA